MTLQIRGISAFLIGIIILTFLIAVFVIVGIIVGGVFLIILPLLIALGLIAFIIRKILPRKKPLRTQKRDYLEAEFKVKG